MAGILVVWFLFYFNRLFATLMSYGLRAYTWHKFRVYIDIQSVQLSLLAGRLFFKGIRYYGENETIYVQQGYITWTYWLLSARQVELARHQETQKPKKTDKKVEKDASTSDSEHDPPDEEPGPISRSSSSKARITVHVSGLEWFVYNRTPVYDAILAEGLGNTHTHSGTDGGSSSDANVYSAKVEAIAPGRLPGVASHRAVSSRASRSTAAPEEKDDLRAAPTATDNAEAEPRTSISTEETDQEQSGPLFSSLYSIVLNFLPVFIECEKGAVLLGNDTTRALIVTTFTKAHGHVDASACGSLDIFRQLFDFEIERPVIQMKPNPDYKHSQATSAERAIFGTEPLPTETWLGGIGRFLQRFPRKLWRGIKRLLPFLHSSRASVNMYSAHERAYQSNHGWHANDAENAEWHGLDRYLDEDELNEHEAWLHLDYARFLTLLDCPSIHFCFYWDLPGEVIPRISDDGHGVFSNDINQAEPPAYGMEIAIRGGMINYGPWTDRLRAEIQTAFLPNSYMSVLPANVLKPGNPRQSTRMEIRIEIDEEVTLRTPTKEGSKDWQWRGRIQALREAQQHHKERTRKHFKFKRDTQHEVGQDTRPFGWFSFSVGADSTVKYVMDLVPGAESYRNSLEMDLKQTRARSSVNHGLLWRCESQQLNCDLSNPVGWNDLHSWIFDIQNESLELFLIRDHMFLLIDLIDDFTAGPKPDYMTFIPFEYQIGLTFANLKLYLNANDANIIDSPSDIDENFFLILGFEELIGSVGIPLIYLNPSQSSVLFKGSGKNAFLDVSAPLSNTLNTFVSKDSIATLKGLELDGSYNYCAASSPQLSDSLILDIEGNGLRLFLHGFLIRYFGNMKDNYFGEDLHFKTLEEYQGLLVGDSEDTVAQSVPGKNENDLDAILTVRANKVCALMPANLYCRKENVRFDVLLAEADMRFTNYYMDLDVKTSPVESSLETLSKEDPATSDSISSCQIFIDGADVVGHRYFGAPPTEPAYLSNFDIEVGDVSGQMTRKFLLSLISAIGCFMFTLDDDENALPPLNPTVTPDAMFLSVRAGSLELWLNVDEAALLLRLPSADVTFDDWAGHQFSKQLLVVVPEIVVAVVDAASAVRQHHDDEAQTKTFAYVRASLDFKMFQKVPDSARARALQQHHIRYHDRRTLRADWLLHDPTREVQSMRQADWAREVPSLALPTIAEPARDASGPSVARRLVAVPGSRQQRVRRQQSFLSADTSTSAAPRKVPQQQSHDHPMTTGHERLPQGPSAYQSVAVSSPWMPPHFTLMNRAVNLQHVPELAENFRYHRQSRSKTRARANTTTSQSTVTSEQSSALHLGLVCTLSRGLILFCTPELFSSGCIFVKRLQMTHPVDLLDLIQIRTIDKVMQTGRVVAKPPKIVDFCVSLPSAKLRLLNQGRFDQPSQVEHQYDVQIDHINGTGRISMGPIGGAVESPIQSPKVLAHAEASTIKVIAAERSIATQEIVSSAEANLADLTFWLGRAESTRSKLQLRGVDCGVTGSKVAEIASLIQATSAMVETLIQQFGGLLDQDLLPYFVYRLITKNPTAVDPLFLTRPSYALRSADRHLRQDDSWKIVSRLRNVFVNLDATTKREMSNDMLDNDFGPEIDVQQVVSSKFEAWRSFDHDGMDRPAVLDVIFGPSKAEIEKSRVADPFEMEVAIGSTKVFLDTGLGASALLLGDMSLQVSSKTSKVERRSMFVQKIRVYSFVSHLELNIDWTIVDLLRDTFDQLGQLEFSNATWASQSASKEDPAKIDLFVVVGTENAMIRVKTPNTSLRLSSLNMNVSTAYLQQLNGHDSLSIMLSSAAGSAKIRSRATTLLGWRIESPNTYISRLSRATAAKLPDDVRIAATSAQLRFEMKQDVLGILDVVQSIIRDEVPAIQTLVKHAESLKPAVATPDNTKATSNVEAHVALLLRDYRLKFSLLPSFTYIFAGTEARTSIIPQIKSRTAVNFDIKNNHHYFRSGEDNDGYVPPALEIPPINGAVLVTPGNKVNSLEIRTAMEKVVFEAAAVRACIDAINRSDLARMIVKIRASIKDVESSVAQLLPTAPSPVVAVSETPKIGLRFISYTTLGGLNIHASAPSIKQKRVRTDLDLMIGFTSFCVHNRTKNKNIIHDRPQFDFNLQELAFGIRRTTPRESVNYGKIRLNLKAQSCTELAEDGSKLDAYYAETQGIEIDLYPETGLLVIDIMAFVQERFKSFTLNEEARTFKPLRRFTVANLEEDLRRFKAQQSIEDSNTAANSGDDNDDARSISIFLNALVSLEINHIRLRWLLNDTPAVSRYREVEDLVFSIQKIDLKKKKEASARLAISNLQLQMMPKSRTSSEAFSFDPSYRSSNSALLPEVVFNAAYVSTKRDRRLAFQLAGKALDLRLASDFILPASTLQESFVEVANDLRDVNEFWKSGDSSDNVNRPQTQSLLGKKRLASLLLDASFAGAIVTITPRSEAIKNSAFPLLKGGKRSRAGRYGQTVQGEAANDATLRSPGIAIKVSYQHDGENDPELSAHLRVAASRNVLYPSVVPLILEISSSIKEQVSDVEQAQEAEQESNEDSKVETSGYLSEAALTNTTPHALLGNCKLNAGLWIQKQEFTLSCQPIAQVAATAKFDDIFVTINTVQAPDQDRFFALVATFNDLNASVQHVYSRESTASFEVKSVVVSAMNSKQVSTKPGISGMINISPMQAEVNAKQLQDFLLFREIWYPPELRQPSKAPTVIPTTADAHVQRYQQAAGGSYLWNAVVSIHELKLAIDLGSGLGKSVFIVEKLWASSKKSSEVEQNLCVGFDTIGIDSTGRMSGFVQLQQFHLRTSIRWPTTMSSVKKAPLIQGAVGFSHFRIKAAFDYQPFAVADISSFEFLMYNVRQRDEARDRLVATLEGDKVQVFIVSTTAAQVYSLYQAFERLIQEKQDAYHASIAELDRFLRRKSIFPSNTYTAKSLDTAKNSDLETVPFALHTDVVVTLQELSLGVFPSTFFDTQILKAEATNGQARFAVSTRNNQTHSSLGMTLGQLRVALSGVSRANNQALSDVSIQDVIQRATNSRGGTILKVPKLVMAMSTWQFIGSNLIEYTFKSVFEGKVDVGWNYSRIGFIRGMWNAHSRALAQRIGKPITQSALKITAEPRPEGQVGGQEKITAVVNMPQSKFDYKARSPPIIDTPQLRDLGEATPSVELFGKFPKIWLKPRFWSLTLIYRLTP